MCEENSAATRPATKHFENAEHRVSPSCKQRVMTCDDLSAQARELISILISEEEG